MHIRELVNLIQGSYQVQNVQIGVNLKLLILFLPSYKVAVENVQIVI
jgi:hypothetical protein